MENEKPLLELGDLSGPGGNAFAILAKARRAARKAKWSSEKLEEFMDEAESGDYDHLLETVEDYFEVI